MEKRNFSEIEKELMTHLSGSKLSKEHLSNISKTISASYAQGLKIVDWWIYGIPAFETFVIQGQLPLAEEHTLQGLVANGSFKGVEILRKGIPRPDFFEVNINIENIAAR